MKKVKTSPTQTIKKSIVSDEQIMRMFFTRLKITINRHLHKGICKQVRSFYEYSYNDGGKKQAALALMFTVVIYYTHSRVLLDFLCMRRHKHMDRQFQDYEYENWGEATLMEKFCDKQWIKKVKSNFLYGMGLKNIYAVEKREEWLPLASEWFDNLPKDTWYSWGKDEDDND